MPQAYCLTTLTTDFHINLFRLALGSCCSHRFKTKLILLHPIGNMFKFKELCSPTNFDRQTFIIAEIGQNHQGDINIAKKLIETAKVSDFHYNLTVYLH